MKKRPIDYLTISHKQLKLSEVGKVQPKKKLDQAEFDKANLKLIIDTVPVNMSRLRDVKVGYILCLCGSLECL